MIEPKLVDIESERWLLQSMLLSEEANDIAFSLLRDDDLTDESHRIVWRHQKRLHESGKPLNVNLFLASLKDARDATGKSDFDKAGGYAFLGKLIEEAVIPYHARHYAERVRKASVFRKLSEAATHIASEVANARLDDDIEELLSRSEQAILDVNDQAAAFEGSRRSFKETVFDALENIQRRCKHGGGDGLKTGLTELDKKTGGLRAGELTILAARPACGKSALALNIAHHMVAKENSLVVFASLEMSALELTERLLGSEAKVMLSSLRGGFLTHDERQAIVETSGDIANYKLFIDDAPSRTISQIASFCRMVRRKHKKLDCVIVDYIQLITPENARDPRQEQVAKISRRLKTMARELKVPVLCLAQLNRQADDGTKAPKLSHLRESGAIEQDADIVLFIHRPNANTPDGGGDCEDAEIHVAKQRNGPTGVVHVRWFRKWCRFENAAEAAWEERKDAVFDAYNKGEDF